ncbi:MAG: DUF4294 domain-containing protein [Tannerella sp.]|jgi:hypothetical protein|nr:DUF4294 domain-containing protein [Tannerella sp.]
MKTVRLLLIAFLCCCFGRATYGQESNSGGLTLKRILPKGLQFGTVEGSDTIPMVYLKEVLVFPPLKFNNEKERYEYTKLVRDVKKTYPFARIVYETLIETYEYIETLPDDKAKDAHLKRMEKELFKQYKPELKKLTLSQGKLLLKLVNRECNQSSYALLGAFLGKFRAGFWNIFAGMLGASLKTTYEPKGKDAMTERVVQLVERGLI